jgi:Na+/pantothenate symporter
MHFYLFGVVGHSQLDVRRWCASRDARALKTSATLGTVLVSLGTLGIYTPRLAEIQCEAAPKPRRAIKEGN